MALSRIQARFRVFYGFVLDKNPLVSYYCVAMKNNVTQHIASNAPAPAWLESSVGYVCAAYMGAFVGDFVDVKDARTRIQTHLDTPV